VNVEAVERGDGISRCRAPVPHASVRRKRLKEKELQERHSAPRGRPPWPSKHRANRRKPNVSRSGRPGPAAFRRLHRALPNTTGHTGLRLNGETHGGHQIIVATDLEITIALVGFLIDSNLVIQ
jgi:hypothetical protein